MLYNGREMLQITATGKLIAENNLIPDMSEEFARHRLLKLPRFLERSILERIQHLAELTEFQPSRYFSQKNDRVLAEEIRSDAENPGIHTLMMLLNNHSLFQVIERITASQKIRSFVGRIARTLPNLDQHMAWHNDNPDVNRLVGISINLSREAYSGGAFQIRDRDSERILGEVSDLETGDAIIFGISHELQHRVTPVVGTASRTTCVGWFYSQPDFLTLMGFDLKNFNNQTESSKK
jgi:hypothetical protein